MRRRGWPAVARATPSLRPASPGRVSSRLSLPSHLDCRGALNAFVPNDGESLNDMLPSQYVELFETIALERGDDSVVLPFSIWREAFINDVDLDTAKRAFRLLNPHPVKTLREKISLKANPAEM